DAGWSSPVARWAHNPKVAGSNPAPATNLNCLFLWGRSSVWQSAGFASLRSGVRTPSPPPLLIAITLGLEEQTISRGQATDCRSDATNSDQTPNRLGLLTARS